MPTFEFALLVEGVAVDDPGHDERLAAAGADDAMLFEQDGVTHIAFYRDASCASLAVSRAVNSVQTAYEHARVLYLDLDLVSTSDIAGRVGLTRQAVAQYVRGTRGPGGFPRSEGVISGGQRIWRWAAVHAWFVASPDVSVVLDDDAWPVPVNEAIQIQEWLRRRLLHGSDACLMIESVSKERDIRSATATLVTTAQGARSSVTHWSQSAAARQQDAYVQ